MFLRGPAVVPRAVTMYIRLAIVIIGLTVALPFVAVTFAWIGYKLRDWIEWLESWEFSDDP